MASSDPLARPIRAGIAAVLIILITIARAPTTALPTTAPAVANAAPHSGVIIVPTPALPHAALLVPIIPPASVALAPPTLPPPTPTAAPEPPPPAAGGTADPQPEKTWVSPDSYTLPGSQIVHYVDSSGQVVDQRLPGSEAWLQDAPAEQPTPFPAVAPAPKTNYCPRCGWHK